MFPKLLFIPRKHSQIIFSTFCRCCISHKDCSPVRIHPETQPKFQPAFLTLSAMISQFFTRLQRVEAFRGSAARMDEDGNQGHKKHRRKSCAAVEIEFLCTARPTTGLQNCRY